MPFDDIFEKAIDGDSTGELNPIKGKRTKRDKTLDEKVATELFETLKKIGLPEA